MIAAEVAGMPRPKVALALGIGRLALLLLRATRRLDALSRGQDAGVQAEIGYRVGAEDLVTHRTARTTGPSSPTRSKSRRS